MAHDLCHGNRVRGARCILNVFFIPDHMKSRLVKRVPQKSASENELVVPSGSLEADRSKHLVSHVNQITGVRTKQWESRCALMSINV